ncbi:MAG: hypothetical protein H7Y00_04375 [Fimbriimonadaceae bacterium]|nr:hypothetical protein [Chitinophagales bacterium]
MKIESYQTIQKEEIPKLEFHNKEVLSELHLIMRRKQLLTQGMVLGNTYHTKVQIIFEAISGILQVETTIWATTEEYVLLKGGVYLPIKCIHDVVIM